jgi:M6 family metalloprotease-like protein
MNRSLYQGSGPAPSWRRLLALLLTLMGWNLHPAEAPDFADYATVRTAITTNLHREARARIGQPGYLGIEVVRDGRGRFILNQVAHRSPAENAGLQPGDLLLKADGQKPASLEQFRNWIQRQEPGAAVRLSVERRGKRLEMTATTDTPSHPLRPAAERGVLGVQANSQDDGEGLLVTRVTQGSPAAQAGLKRGDLLLQVDGSPLLSSTSLTDALTSRAPGDKVTVKYRHGGTEAQFEAQLVPAATPEEGNPFVPRRTWKKGTFRLAVIGVEFADTPHNESVPLSEWERFFFSTNGYGVGTNATGQAVHGSVDDYYRELSCGLFHFEGKVFNWVRLAKNRADYAQGTVNRRSRSEFFGEMLDALTQREGPIALKDFDGLAVIYAGERFAAANRGTLFWPHRSAANYRGKAWPYVICPEGGKRMANISVFCHEFGHILGLPDLYARPETPGVEGVGAWCAMSNQAGNGRPQHFSAWCKEQLGWLQPALIDPAVKQRLMLNPVEGSTNECFKVLIRPDGGEYLLLENRQKRGFDRSLPAAGLLIWHVVGNRLTLEESHGVEGSGGPRIFLNSVPYPSAANDAFTPYTTPSSRPHLGGGRPVDLTDIRQLPDGRITFQIGHEYQ